MSLASASGGLLRLFWKTISQSIWLLEDTGPLVSEQGPQTFFVKDEIVTVLGFPGPLISVTATQLCCSRMKAALGNM